MNRKILIVVLIFLSSIFSIIFGQDKTTLHVVYRWTVVSEKAFEELFANAIEEFNLRYPNVEVKVDKLTGAAGDYRSKISMMMRSSETAPDVVYEDSFMIGSDASARYLLPLDDFVSSWEDWEKFYPSMKDIVKYQDSVYGVMLGTDVLGLWVNNKILEKAGINTPWQPTCWEDVLEAAILIKEKVPGVIPFNLYVGTAVSEAATMRGFLPLLYGTELGKNAFYDYDTQKWVAYSPGLKEIFQFIHDVYAEELGPSLQNVLNPQWGSGIIETQFIPQGKLAINLDGMWLIRTWQEGGAYVWPEWEEVMDFVAFPTQYGQSPGKVSMSGGWAWSIPALSKNHELSWEFIKILTNAENIANYNASIGNVSVREDSLLFEKYVNMPFSAKFTELMNYTYYRPSLPKYPQVSFLVQTCTENLILGASVEKTLKDYEKGLINIVGKENVEYIEK